MKFALLGLLGNIAMFLLFAFANWEINPVYWVTKWRAICAALMGTVIFTTTFAYIIKLASKNRYDLDKD